MKRPRRFDSLRPFCVIAIGTLRVGYHDWRTRHQATRLADYYDEIEREFDELEARGAKYRTVEE